jgi:hypothetical protein
VVATAKLTEIGGLKWSNSTTSAHHLNYGEIATINFTANEMVYEQKEATRNDTSGKANK